MGTKIYAESKLPTQHGEFRLRCYRGPGGQESLALLSSYIDVSSPVNVRIHSSCMTSEVFGSQRCDCKDQLEMALDYIAIHSGLVIYLLQEGRGIGLGDKVRAYALQDYGYDTLDANEVIGLPTDKRDYNDAVSILNDLAIATVNLMTNNPEKIDCLTHAGIKVARRLPASVELHPASEKYIKTKRERCGHF